ncbi:MAG: hypothetical protein H7066_14775 [Cytophagaceae bacterium]|nr:hypothetical protein [Gemmatimonadaceae bacterium]
MREPWRSPGDRSGRGRPAVPSLAFDRRSTAQRRAAVRLPFVVGAAILGFALVEPSLVRLFGGLWGELATLVITGTPIGAAWASATREAGPWAAWKTGALFAFASAAWYAWIFTGAWV